MAAIAPFQRFVTAKPPTDLLPVTEWEEEYEAYKAAKRYDDHIDTYEEPAICDGCDQPLDPELDYCWTCQCT